MLKDCIEVFERIIKKEGDKCITDRYILSPGTYILVKNDKIEELEVLPKTKLKKSEEELDECPRTELYNYFAERDYLSNYLNSNKCVDTKVITTDKLGKKINIGSKVVMSNNYLTFFTKKEHLGVGKINNAVIEKYYNSLESKYGIEDEYNLTRVKEWMLKKFIELGNEKKDQKGVFKIFFEADIKDYIYESGKYLEDKIYNNNDYNIKIKGVEYGVPDNNMNLNKKKPMLFNRTRRTTVPYILPREEAVIRKKFFDLLLTYYEEGKRLIFFDEINTKIIACDMNESRPENFSGYFLRISKDKKGIKIEQIEHLVDSNSEIKDLVIEKIIDINYEKLQTKNPMSYGPIEKLEELENVVNKILFKGNLKKNYFVEAKDLSVTDYELKQVILETRCAFWDWFLKGDIEGIKSNFERFSLRLVFNTLLQDSYAVVNAAQQLNLRWSILKFLKGDAYKVPRAKELKEIMKRKSQMEDPEIETDEEFYFMVGQLYGYMIAIRKPRVRTYQDLIPLLNAKNSQRIKDLLIALSGRNFHVIFRNKRFATIYAMVLDYPAGNKINPDILLSGVLYSNLFLEKKDSLEIDSNDK